MKGDRQDEKLEMTYPATWGYRVIGLDEPELRRAISEIFKNREYTITISNKSSAGKYVSLHVELIVYDEAERMRLYAALRDHRATHIIL